MFLPTETVTLPHATEDMRGWRRIPMSKELEKWTMLPSRLWSSEWQEDLGVRPRHSTRGLHRSLPQSGTIRTTPRWPGWGVVSLSHCWDPQSEASGEPAHTQALLSEPNQWIWWGLKPTSCPPVKTVLTCSNKLHKLYSFCNLSSCFLIIIIFSTLTSPCLYYCNNALRFFPKWKGKKK